MWYRVPNLEAALRCADDLKSSGKATWFRGQTRSWPLVSSWTRKEPSELPQARARLSDFFGWIREVPALAMIAEDEDSVIAIAQHYGIATAFVDFTSEPRVAAFFASHKPPTPPDPGKDFSCILCLDLEELQTTCAAARLTRPTLMVPRLVRVSVPGLLRIEAQYGVFLEYPHDQSFERHIYDFDRIIFPTERDPEVLRTLVPECDVYPTQKSDLEALIEQFFMLEHMQSGTKAIREMPFARQRWSAPSDGLEAECFQASGLPTHASWLPPRLQSWQHPAPESWTPASNAPPVSLLYPNDQDSRRNVSGIKLQMRSTLAERPALRAGPVAWQLSGAPEAAVASTVRALELVWDGTRLWPYDEDEIAEAVANAVELGVLVAMRPDAKLYPDVACQLVHRCFGDTIEVEIGMSDGSYTRGYASRAQLKAAVREDFESHLAENWRTKITEIEHVMQIAFNPQKALVFDRLKTVFGVQIIPTQAVLRDEASGKARLYNPARACRFGLP